MAGLSSCAAPAPAALPDGVTVAVVQYRLDYAPRALELKVTNGTDDPLEVTSARFVSPAFAGAASRERDATIPAGATRDLRVLLPEAVCAAQADPAPRIELDVAGADGTPASGSLAPRDPLGTIAKILQQDCIAEKAGEVAVFEAGAALRTEERDGVLTALLDVTATPTGAPGTVTVATVERTVLLRPAAGGTGWPVDWTLDADSGGASATLEVLPSNCNPHIVAEDKRGTYFPLAVTTADGSQGLVYVGVTTDVRRQLYEYVAAFCGW